MNISPHFYTEEKVDFLRKLGFEVKMVLIGMSYSCYHNDVECEDQEVWAVYRNKREYLRPYGYNFKKEDWLDNVFYDEINKKIKNILLN